MTSAAIVVDGVWPQAFHWLSTVDPTSAAVQAARALGISFGDCASMTSPFHAAAEECFPDEAETNGQAHSQPVAVDG